MKCDNRQVVSNLTGETMTEAGDSGYYNNVIKIALTPYTRGISQFILRQMKRAYGDDEQKVADAIRSLLGESKNGHYFAKNLNDGRPLEKSFGPGAFPQLVNRDFGKSFSGFLRGDTDRRFRNILYNLRDDRNDATYDSEGMTKEECQRVLDDMIWALRKAGQQPEREDVERIKDQLETGTVRLTAPSEDVSPSGSSDSDEPEEVLGDSSAVDLAEVDGVQTVPDQSEGAMGTVGSQEDSAQGSYDDLLEDGSYEATVVLVSELVSRNGNNQYVVDFAVTETGEFIKNWYPLLQQSLRRLSQLMLEFSVDVTGIEDTITDTKVRTEIKDRLSAKLVGETVSLEVGRGVWDDGRPRNIVRRVSKLQVEGDQNTSKRTSSILEEAGHILKSRGRELDDDLPF